ncbi:MAG: type II secretion system F family protein [Deltaproteobacteria bacterium]|nr:type II secretion system F family protein [Deltaproteobacteria bacterium]
MSILEITLALAPIFILGAYGINCWQRRQISSRRLARLSGVETTPSVKFKINSWKKMTQELKIGFVFFFAAVATCLALNLRWWLALALVAFSFPSSYWLIKRRRLQKARREFASYFPDAVDSLTRAIQAGMPVEKALTSMGDLYHGEIGERFRRLAQLLELGMPFREALSAFARRLDLPDVDFFCAILALNRESGSRLNPLLVSLSQTLRERAAVDRKLQGMTAESRGAARILTVLPIIVIGLQTFLNPKHLQFLLNDPSGRLLLGYAAVSMGAGFLIINRMSRLMES